MGLPLNKEVKHWSGAKYMFTKRHECDGSKEYDEELVFDSVYGEWLWVGEYIYEFKYCPQCGEDLYRMSIESLR